MALYEMNCFLESNRGTEILIFQVCPLILQEESIFKKNLFHYQDFRAKCCSKGISLHAVSMAPVCSTRPSRTALGSLNRHSP